MEIDEDRHSFERARRETLRIERIVVSIRSILRGQQLRVRDLDPPLTAGRDREDARRQGIATDVLEKCRVDCATDVILVDRPRLVGIENPRLERLAVDPHREARHDRSGWKRENVSTLDIAARAVAE